MHSTICIFSHESRSLLQCYYPYCLYSKKRYAGLMYTSPDHPDYIDIKGLQLVRRDSPPIVKVASQAVLDALMHDKSADKAVSAAQDAVLRILREEEPLERFVVSKSLSGSYANPDGQPHVQVARKIRERTGERVPTGSRVPYVFVIDDNIDSKLISAKAEDPEYVAERGIPLDAVYYVESQVLSPLKTLLEVVIPTPDRAIMDHPDIARILSEKKTARDALVRTTKRVKTNASNKQHEITKFFSAVSS